MNDKQTNTNRLKIIIPEPVPYILITNTRPGKWKVCIYLATSDQTGQALIFMKDKPAEYSGIFFKNPVYIFSAGDRSELDSKISEKIKAILKNQKKHENQIQQ